MSVMRLHSSQNSVRIFSHRKTHAGIGLNYIFWEVAIAASQIFWRLKNEFDLSRHVHAGWPLTILYFRKNFFASLVTRFFCFVFFCDSLRLRGRLQLPSSSTFSSSTSSLTTAAPCMGHKFCWWNFQLRKAFPFMQYMTVKRLLLKPLIRLAIFYSRLTVFFFWFGWSFFVYLSSRKQTFIS